MNKMAAKKERTQWMNRYQNEVENKSNDHVVMVSAPTSFARENYTKQKGKNQRPRQLGLLKRLVSAMEKTHIPCSFSS